jgi:uncharacterized Zn-binding protein involved in type VI secretion
MGQPAARISDMHACPIHGGGPVLTGQDNVLIGGLPAARITDKAFCPSSPPDVIVEGEPTVLIGGLPASRMGDKTAHGGVISVGEPTVLIGRKHGLSAAEAQKLFDKLASDKDIPFDYPLDCCYARANEMCRLLENGLLGGEKIPCGKTWYYAAPGGSLSVSGLPKTPVIRNGSLAWGYHVAPTVEVDGKTMVFDPSLFKEPVTLDEWHSIMKPSGGSPVARNTDSKPFYTNSDETYTEYDGDYKKTNASFGEHVRARNAAIAADSH